MSDLWLSFIPYGMILKRFLGLPTLCSTQLGCIKYGHLNGPFFVCTVLFSGGINFASEITPLDKRVSSIYWWDKARRYFSSKQEQDTYKLDKFPYSTGHSQRSAAHG